MEFDNIWKNLTSSCKNLTSTRKNLTEFDKILDRPDCTAENSCSKICSRLCQILSNSVKFLQARSRNFPKSVKRQLRQFELQSDSVLHNNEFRFRFCSSNRTLKARSDCGENWRVACKKLACASKPLKKYGSI